MQKRKRKKRTGRAELQSFPRSMQPRTPVNEERENSGAPTKQYPVKKPFPLPEEKEETNTSGIKATIYVQCQALSTAGAYMTPLNNCTIHLGNQVSNKKYIQINAINSSRKKIYVLEQVTNNSADNLISIRRGRCPSWMESVGRGRVSLRRVFLPTDCNSYSSS